ncbi:ANK [Seminavis robusta]|uniref:ANK n=1 Tax=Seminavis robusta TaxID=568900 RepID=A0A9N8EMP5_9STRA|nr:ANK [Seminavis robusta]CAB9523518.1 ANK [Seminavis robusta]|eukprot:Sro1038_g234230.1 ANK (289) ;mRNA; r:147-1013
MPTLLDGASILPLLRGKQAAGTLEAFLEKKGSAPEAEAEAVTTSTKKPPTGTPSVVSEDSQSISTSEKQKKHDDPLLSGKPSDCLKLLLKDVSTPNDSFSWEEYFDPLPSATMDQFPSKVIKALHKDDPEALQKLHKRGMFSWNCQNKYGERLSHLASREGAAKVMKFLAKQAKVPLRVRDKSGKTLLHEVCWFTHPPQLEIASILLADSPELLWAPDSRGWTALEYVPQKCRKEWCVYLKRKQSFIRLMLQLKSSTRESAKLYEKQQRLLQIIQKQTGRMAQSSSAS